MRRTRSPRWRRTGRPRCGSGLPLGLPSAAALETLISARERLVTELREHALVIGEVTLTSGRKAQYYVDAKRAILRPAGFLALAELVAAEARRGGATAVGGVTLGGHPIAGAALGRGAGAQAFFLRQDPQGDGPP